MSERSEQWQDHGVVLERGADPHMARLDGRYAYVTSGENDTALLIGLVDSIDELATMTLARIECEMPPNASMEIWAPELHQIDGELYIYYAADAGDNGDHRMHVLRAADPKDPSGRWEYAGQMKTEHDNWAIDGTVLQTELGNFFIWSGWEGTNSNEQYLYISRMISATEVEAQRFRISSPEYEWEAGEKGDFKINEGPAILQHEGRTWCVYSASCSWTDEYCLGIMELVGDNPLDPQCWQKRDVPLFAQVEGLYGPGHCSFTTSAEGDTYMFYHTAVRKGAGWEREIRCVKIGFDADGEPVVPPYQTVTDYEDIPDTTLLVV